MALGACVRTTRTAIQRAAVALAAARARASHRATIASAAQVCLAKCMDRYLDAMALVSQTWAQRAKAQAAMGGGDGLN